MSALLKFISRAERWLAILAFAVMTLALLADVISRKAFQTGLIGSTEVAVIGMIALAMFGVGIATDEGAHFRLSVLDALIPKALAPAIDRIASVLTATFFLVFGALAFNMVLESAVLGDRTEIVRAPVWVLQTILLIAFITNALRYLIYALDPKLKPDDRPADRPEAAEEAA